MKSILNESIAENESADAASIAAYCLDYADLVIEKVVESVNYMVNRRYPSSKGSENDENVFTVTPKRYIASKIDKDAIRASMGVPENWKIRNKWDCFEYDGRYSMCQAFVCTIPDAMKMFTHHWKEISEMQDASLVGVVHRCDGKLVSVTVVSGVD